jgi:monovalent cation:H+ antiporter-2, CPA2 family
MPSPLELTLLLLACSVLGVVLFRSLHLPPILGYLAVGVALGPHSLGWAGDSAATKYLAEFGVVFLMFSIGLEFNLSKLKTMKRLVFGLGASQVTFTILLALPSSLALGFLFNLSWQAAFALGGALAMSSTAIVTKMLAERLELETEHARNVMGILLFQDLAVVPLLIMIPALGQEPSDLLWVLILATVKIFVALVLIFFIGSKIMSRWLHIVVARRSQELFTLNLLLITLGMAALTEHFGLSLALGAFLAGMLISETPYHHQVEEDIKPFRDVLLGLFFITIGMLLNLNIVIAHWPFVLFLLFVPVIFKFALITGLARLFGSHSGVAMRTGLVLAQAGEFGFVLLNQMGSLNLVAPELLQIVLAAMILSMLVAPFLIEYSEKIVLRFSANEWMQRSLTVTRIATQSIEQDKHAIICGFGRCGQILAHMLEQENLAYTALDLDPDRIREAKLAGQSVVYGDAARPAALHAAGLSRASVVIISHAHVPSAIKTLRQVQALAPAVPVIVRSLDDANLALLSEAGATEVVPELIEGSMILASHALVLMGVPMRRVLRHMRQTRDARYAMLRGYFHGSDDGSDEPDETQHIRLQTLQLPSNVKVIGRKVSELRLKSMQVEVAAIRRNGVRNTMSLSQTELEGGDVLVLRGTFEALAHAQTYLLETGRAA